MILGVPIFKHIRKNLVRRVAHQGGVLHFLTDQSLKYVAAPRQTCHTKAALLRSQNICLILNEKEL